MTGSTATFGEHFLVDLHGCNTALIATKKTTQEALLSAATRCGSTIIEYHFHQFSPHGVSGVILIAESHFSVHTWPEDGFVAVDIFTSGEVMKPEVAIELLKVAFSADRVDVMKVTRGELVTDSGGRGSP